MQLPDAHHRPWPMPQRPWLIRMRWIDLLFAHWPLDPALLRPLVPKQLEIDSFELAIEGLALEYRQTDSYRRDMSPKLLKEISENPDHPQYPNISENRKLEILDEVRGYLKGQKIDQASIKMIERDMAEVVSRALRNAMANSHAQLAVDVSPVDGLA